MMSFTILLHAVAVSLLVYGEKSFLSIISIYLKRWQSKNTKVTIGEVTCMRVLLENMPMIVVNSVLAVIPLLCGWLMFKTRHKWLQGAFALLWFSFVPNTLYILTDVRYLPKQWHAVSLLGKLALAGQYLLYELLGVSSFLLALSLLEKTWLRSRWREHKGFFPCLLITLNFFIGFGMVLGRVHRLNSWDIFLAAPKVIDASFHILSSAELLLLVGLFGVLANAVYFLFRTYRGGH